MKTNTLILLATFSLSFTHYSFARPAPPQEAFDACQSKSKGTACIINAPRGQISGICRKPPREAQLLCIPKGHSGKKHRKGDKQRKHFSRHQKQCHPSGRATEMNLDKCPKKPVN